MIIEPSARLPALRCRTAGCRGCGRSSVSFAPRAPGFPLERDAGVDVVADVVVHVPVLRAHHVGRRLDADGSGDLDGVGHGLPLGHYARALAVDPTPRPRTGRALSSVAVGIPFPWSTCALLAGLLAQAAPPTAMTFSLRVSIAVDDAGKPVARPSGSRPSSTRRAPSSRRSACASRRPRAPRSTRASPTWRLAPTGTRSRRTWRRMSSTSSSWTPLRDVDDTSQMRRGVHWHAPSGAH